MPRGNVARFSFSPAADPIGAARTQETVLDYDRSADPVRYGRTVWFKGDVFTPYAGSSLKANHDRGLLDLFGGSHTRMFLYRRDMLLRIKVVKNSVETLDESTGITLTDDVWQAIEVRVTPNSADGVADGIVEIYIDEAITPDYTRTDLNWISEGHTSFFDHFYFGATLTVDADDPTYQEYRYWDDAGFSTQPSTMLSGVLFIPGLIKQVFLSGAEELLAVASTFTAGVGKGIGRALAVTSAFTVALSRSMALARILAATSAFTPVVAKIAAKARALAATSTFGVAISRGIGRPLSVASSFVPALSRIAARLRTLAVGSAFTPTVTASRTFFRSLAATSTVIAGLVVQPVVTIFRTLAATSTFTPAIARAFAYRRSLIAAATFVPSVARLLGRTVLVAIGSVFTAIMDVLFGTAERHTFTGELSVEPRFVGVLIVTSEFDGEPDISPRFDGEMLVRAA